MNPSIYISFILEEIRQYLFHIIIYPLIFEYIYLLKCRTIDAWMDSNNRHFSLYREKRNYLSKHSWVATFLGLLFGQRYISNLPKWFAVSSISTSISCKFERYRCDVKEEEKLKGKKNWWNGLFFVIVRLLWRKKKF